MSTYLSEEEQVEALKKWWKDNGKSVIVGAVLGFGIIFGWQGWQAYQVNQGQAASQIFADMQQAVAAGKQEDIDNKAQQLLNGYGSSEYAAMAALQLAKVAYVANDKEKARGHLKWTVENTGDSVLKEIALLRLAKLLLDMQQTDAAKNLLAKGSGGALSGEFAQLRGDLAYQSGDLAAARNAYQDALAKGVGNMALLNIKLADLAGANE